ncbi:MAG: hypothetical protein K0R08_87 [Solimicrobium sp.]|nr:hypothetical protein [Solimicrobium sp.]
MKTIKPQRLTVLTRVYEYQSRFFLAVNASVFFDFNQPRQLLTEVEMWKFLARTLGKDTMLDMGIPKQRGEFLVYGKCHAYQGVPITASTVHIKVGVQEKTLNVFGERHWQRQFGVTTLSGPAPFTEIDLTYANAFGGPDYPLNPSGKGMPVQGQNQNQSLPNIELPGSLMLSPDDRPNPAGLNAINFSWPQRMAKMGTYDDKWLKTRYPGYADDIDWSIFNIAPEDQWLSDFFKGNEAVEIRGMHSQKEVQHVTLPECMAACFITQRTTEGDCFREITMHPETLTLFPSDERGILLFRGVTEINTDDGADVIHLVAGAEKLGISKTIKHYQDVLAIRLDKKKGALHSLDDAPLLPPVPALLCKRSGMKEQAEQSDQTLSRSVSEEKKLHEVGLSDQEIKIPEVTFNPPGTTDQIMAETKATLQRQHTKLLELAKQYALPATAIDKINNTFSSDFSLEKLDFGNIDPHAEMLKQQAVSEKRLREICLKQNLNFDALMNPSFKLSSEPPKPTAETIMQHLESIREKLKVAGKTSEGLDQLIAESPTQLAEQDAQLLAHYVERTKKNAQISLSKANFVQENQAKTPKDTSEFMRGGSYVGQDFTGIDLSGLDLRGADFSAAILEKADLSHAQLEEANFGRAKLSHANLDGANLTKANFSEAKLNNTKFGNAVAHKANFNKAALSYADFGSADFRGANFVQCNFLNVKLGCADFTEVLAKEAKFIYSESKNIDADRKGITPPEIGFPMHGIRFTRADLTKALFLKCKMDDVDFSDACLEKASFISVKGDKVNFRNARLTKSCVVQDSVFTGANFADAILKGSNLRGVNLEDACFERACLENADLSGCNLNRTDFKHTQATGARFTKADCSEADLSGANLHKAVMRKTKLQGTKLVAANLYQGDMLRAQIDATTNFDQANLKKTMIKVNK